MKELGPNTSKAEKEVASTAPLNLFPIDVATTRSTLRKIQTRMAMSNKETVIEESLMKIRKENESLYHDAINGGFDMPEDATEDYLLGVITSYEIVQQQAHIRGREVPTVSQNSIDDFNADQSNFLNFNIEGKFWDGVDKVSGKDFGFIIPIKETALDITEPMAREGFLTGVFDIYHQVKKAELASSKRKSRFRKR